MKLFKKKKFILATSSILTIVVIFLAIFFISKSSFITTENIEANPVVESSSDIELPISEGEVTIGTSEPELVKNRIGTGKIEMEGQTVNFKMDIPVNGGEITGSASGFCSGSMKGAFDIRTNYIHGEMDGKCIGIPATGTFKGEIDLEKGIGSGNFEGKTLFITKSGSWSMIVE